MKQSYSGFTARENKGFIDVPPAGCYEAVILNVRFIPSDDASNKFGKDYLELFLDITEGEYKGRYMELWNNNKERFGDNAFYRGTFRLFPPAENDEPWKKQAFEGAIWCVEQSNGFEADGKTPLYHWDWDETKLAKKKVGINVRRYLSTSNGKNRETTEICNLETIANVRAGKCKPMKDRDKRTVKDSPNDEQNFTEVSGSVDVPW